MPVFTYILQACNEKSHSGEWLDQSIDKICKDYFLVTFLAAALPSTSAPSSSV
ncbi:hypothetical protein D3C71_88800 [compost metagenome]